MLNYEAKTTLSEMLDIVILDRGSQRKKLFLSSFKSF